MSDPVRGDGAGPRLAGSDPRLEPPGTKAEARRLTRTRRLRFCALPVIDRTIEVALPPEVT